MGGSFCQDLKSCHTGQLSTLSLHKAKQYINSIRIIQVLGILLKKTFLIISELLYYIGTLQRYEQQEREDLSFFVKRLHAIEHSTFWEILKGASGVHRIFENEFTLCQRNKYLWELLSLALSIQ